MHGYMGQVLHVNLSSGEIQEEKISDAVYEAVLSGVGLGAYILYRDIPVGADPLGPENVLGLTSGLLTGTASLMSGRWMAVCKSPLTGGIGEANCGGHFSPEIKKVGYDAIFFKGIAENPVYLYVDNKGAELRDASHVWGKDGVEAEAILTAECTARKKPRVAVIGQAGEKLSLISGIMTDGGRMAARSGVGAVMGSKRLKAVVLNGSKRVRYHDPDGMKAYSAGFADRVRDASFSIPPFAAGIVEVLMGTMMGRSRYHAITEGSSNYGISRRYGTHVGTRALVIAGDAPVKNWQGGPADYPLRDSKHVGLNGAGIDIHETTKYHCAQCALGCGGIVSLAHVPQAQGKFTQTHKPEYETMAAFGPLLLNTSPESIFYINEVLNRAGMDTISAGTAVAFAIECNENGMLTDEQTGGLKLNWGNADAIVALIEQMISRETWLGDTLADGVKHAAKVIGNGADAYAVTAGGQEPGMHDPRFEIGQGINFSANPTPGRHTNGAESYNSSFLWEHVSYAPEPERIRKTELLKPNADYALGTVLATAYKMLIDGAGACMFAAQGGVNAWNLFQQLELATGWGKTADDYIETGKRMNTLRQMFNIKHGIDPWDFVMHERLETPRESGPNKGRRVDIRPIVSEHYKQHGWNARTGHPTAETVHALDLDALLDEVA